MLLFQNSSPACTELEMVVMDWLAKAINLPEHFLNSHSGPGAGMIQVRLFLKVSRPCMHFMCTFQSTASDSTLVALLAARNRRLFSMRAKTRCSFSNPLDTAAISTLVAYCSDQVRFRLRHKEEVVTNWPAHEKRSQRVSRLFFVHPTPACARCRLSRLHYPYFSHPASY